MTSELTYLEKIYKELEKMAKSGNSAGLAGIAKAIATMSVQQTNVSMNTGNQTNVNLGNIEDKLDKGLLTTVQEEQGGQTVEVVKSLLELLRTALVEAIHDELTTTIVINNTPTEVNIAYLLSGIMTANQSIATALSGLGTVLGQIQTNTANTAERLLDGNNVSAGANLALIQSNTGSTYSDVQTIKEDIHDTGGIKDDVDAVKTDVGTIKTNTSLNGIIPNLLTDIWQKIPSGS